MDTNSHSPQGFKAYKPLKYSTTEMLQRAVAYRELLQSRRSVRSFSDVAIPYSVIREAILAAGTAPSGANKQPWTFCVVGNPELKREIRLAAEQEEFESYNGRMSQEWIDDLKPLGTNHQKPFLETAPYLIIVFKRVYEQKEGTRQNNYYVNESVGIAVGILLSALHNSGLSTLTHTPSPMNFLTAILNRPENERPFLLIPVGYASPDAHVPDIKRKSETEIIAEYF